jgi:hypothetical protein
LQKEKLGGSRTGEDMRKRTENDEIKYHKEQMYISI